MYDEKALRNMTDLLTNPLFKMDFFNFYLKMQAEGIEAAQRFWQLNNQTNSYMTEFYEKMIDFYIILGLVPRSKLDEAVKENDKLKEENRFLKDTINQLQLNIFKEGGEQVRTTWTTIIDKQLEVNKEFSKNFFDVFRQLTSSGVQRPA